MICIFITLDYGFPGKYSNDLAAETVGARKNQTTAAPDATAAAAAAAATATTPSPFNFPSQQPVHERKSGKTR